MKNNISNIWAVGRNYREHAKELDNEVPTKQPLIFLKAGSCAHHDQLITLPSLSNEIHYELELALRFGQDLQFEAAGLALDLTARDIQKELKTQGHPWTLAKSFRESCPLSEFVNVPPEIPHFDFELQVNGQTRQKGKTHEMIFNFEVLRIFILEHFPVRPGDLLLTGTPTGVSILKAGDHLEAFARSELNHEIITQWVVSSR